LEEYNVGVAGNKAAHITLPMSIVIRLKPMPITTIPDSDDHDHPSNIVIGTPDPRS
jgi:hypothetical protein